MGQGSKFDSALSTKGGRSNFITASDIASGDKLAKEILDEMKKENVKFSKDKIVFVAKLENGNKVFLETGGVDHIMNRHGKQFEQTFGTKTKEDVTNVLCETISKGKLVSSVYRKINGVTYYSNKYYHNGKYCIVYGISENGYIETAYPEKHNGGKNNG